ncbi:MAG: HEAT repeat domain-containing protein [Planctomycetota bacterium]
MLRSRKNYILLATLALILPPLFAAEEADPYAQIISYKYGDSPKPLGAIQAAVRAAKPEELKDIESKLLKVLQSPEATAPCKGFICGVLRQIGSEQCIAPVAALLADKDVCDRACIALRSLSIPKADEALREAVTKIPEELRGSVVQALGARRDRKAVEVLRHLTGDKITVVSAAAVTALGLIGGPEALDAIKHASADPAVYYQALLRCADQMVAEGKNPDAAAVYGAILNPDAAAVYGAILKDSAGLALRTAALRGLVASDKVQAVAAVTAALKDKDRKFQTLAIQCVADAGDTELINKVLGDLVALDPEQQAVLLGLVEHKVLLPAALMALNSENAEVRSAALKAIGRVGEAAQVPALLAVAEKSDADAREVQAALGSIKDSKVDEALLAQLALGDSKQTRAALAALGSRNAHSALPAILKLAAACKDEALAAELGKALVALAAPGDMPELVKLLLAAELPALRIAAASAVMAQTALQGTARETADLLAPAVAQANPELKAALLEMLGKLGGEKSLELIRGALNDASEKIKDAAVRALSDCPDDSVAGDLLKIATTGGSPVHQVLALRGYIRLAGLPGKERTAEQTVAMFKKAAELAKQAQEKKLLVAKLAEAPATPETLTIAAGYLEDADARAEAALAALKLADGLADKDPALADKTVHRITELHEAGQIRLTDPMRKQLAQVQAKIEKRK